MLISCDNGYDNKRNRKKTAAAESADTDDKHPTKVGLYSFHLHAALRAEWIRNTGDSKYANDMQAAKEIWLCAQSTFLKFVGTMAKKAFIEGPLH